MKNILNPKKCRLCGGETEFFEKTAPQKVYYKCKRCSYLQSRISKELMDYVEKGKGGPGGWDSGHREIDLTKLLLDRFLLKKILLHGTGNSPAMETLISENIDVYGSDIVQPLIMERKQKFGDDRFFHNYNMPNIKFDGIVSVEVFEHLIDPVKEIKLFENHLSRDGIIAIETDIYPGFGKLKDRGEYALSLGHVSYWTEQAFKELANITGFNIEIFEIKFLKDIQDKDILFPNREVIFLYKDKKHEKIFKELREEFPVLPIDKP